MYCNPIILLGLEQLPLEALSPERRTTAKRELLEAYRSSGAQVLHYAGVQLPYRVAWDYVDRLDAPEWRRCFHQLLQEKDVEALLQGQWTLNFPNVLQSPIWKDTGIQEPLQQLAEPIIARQLLTAVQQHYRKRVQELVALIGAQQVLRPERCYAQVLHFLEFQGNILHFSAPEPQLPDYSQRVNALSKDLKAGYLYEARTLNLLPETYFKNTFTAFSLSLCVAAERTFTAKPDFSRKLFSVARLLRTDKATQQQADFRASQIFGKWEPPIDESEPEPPMPQPRRQQANTATGSNTPPPKQKQTGWSPPKNPPPLKNKPPQYPSPPPPAYQPRVTPINSKTGEHFGKWLLLLLSLIVLGIMIFETGFCR